VTVACRINVCQVSVTDLASVPSEERPTPTSAYKTARQGGQGIPKYANREASGETCNELPKQKPTLGSPIRLKPPKHPRSEPARASQDPKGKGKAKAVEFNDRPEKETKPPATMSYNLCKQKKSPKSPTPRLKNPKE
jgi:hypothetical protein